MGKAGETFKGAAGGAATGATIGSVAGPYGAAIGGAVGAIGGGLMGYFGSGDENEQQRQIEEYRRQVLGRDVPQIGRASIGSLSGFRSNQQGLVDRLERMSRGEGPSMVTEQFDQLSQRNAAQQISQAQSGRGNATLANIVAANNVGSFNQQAAQQAGIAKIAEQQMALNQLGGAIQAGRSADEDVSKFNALQQNYAEQANLAARLKMMGLTDDAILEMMRQSNMMAMQPTTGDKLLAGGTGSLGMWAANKKKAA